MKTIEELKSFILKFLYIKNFILKLYKFIIYIFYFYLKDIFLNFIEHKRKWNEHQISFNRKDDY